ncbi:diguanylate cyclase [Parapusillimonas sp. SGNA-6]|nr:diguanylate cyclase [Parapusillimonas sp. SGNA-6]
MLSRLFRIDLARLILWMCLFFVFLALGNSLYAAYRVQHELLLQSSREGNSVFAEKLATVADTFFRASSNILRASALDLAAPRLDAETARAELEQLAGVTQAFNAVMAVDASGTIVAAVPEHTAQTGAELKTPEGRKLLEAREKAVITRPFKNEAGNWIMMLAHPTFSSEGAYTGFIAGQIHLRNGNGLQAALGEHRYKDGSYFYVVDDEGNVIHHPVMQAIGQSYRDRPAVAAVLRGERGTTVATHANGAEQLVNYAPVELLGWGVVSVRPKQAALSSLGELFWRTFSFTLPAFVLSLLGIWWLTRLITRPLEQLAEVAANLDNRDNFSRIRFVRGWYYEAALLRKGLLRGFSAVGLRLRRLHREGATDLLTGLMNRRGLNTAIQELADSGRSVAAVVFDVDYFKTVNDTHGHAVGDEVLKAIATVSQDQARIEDVVARMGGEEFLVLLPDTGLEPARRFAERLRQTIEQTRFPIPERVTISLGVACYPDHGADIMNVLMAADDALYEAKSKGRNRVYVAHQ